jgi:hypothetical protein
VFLASAIILAKARCNTPRPPGGIGSFIEFGLAVPFHRFAILTERLAAPRIEPGECFNRQESAVRYHSRRPGVATPDSFIRDRSELRALASSETRGEWQFRRSAGRATVISSPHMVFGTCRDSGGVTESRTRTATGVTRWRCYFHHRHPCESKAP